MLSVDQSNHAINSYVGQDVFTDINNLNNINRLADSDENAALKKMAQQFEGLFIQIMLKTMREASSAFGDEQSNEMGFHQSMFDNQLALNLSSGRGLGLADSFYQQMLANYSESGVVPPEYKLEKSILPVNQAIEPSPAKEAVPNNPYDFVKTIYPHAERIGAVLGVDPDILIAQSALETGWGQHVIQDKYGRSSYNFFNIKADSRWSGDQVAKSTLEFHQGVATKETANFRRYETIEDSFKDYAQFILTEPRYKTARTAASGQDYVRALQREGYATDPNYAEKVLDVLKHDAMNARPSHRK